MGTRERFEPGTFSWCDLGTTDPEAAKAFYQGLLGWDHEDVPVGGGQVYTMARVDGRSVAAIYGQPDAQREAGIPPAWLSYVTVEDADATAARAAELGGTVMLPPFDVMEAGRMAVLFDPQGAAFAVWQPKDSIGAELVNAPGAICWNQLSTTDTDAARAFYADLFGWTDEGVEGSEVPYWTLKNGDAMNGGLMPLDPASGVPPHWLTVFAAEDVDAASSGAGELGGQVALPAMDVPDGRFAVVVDPQGAAFGLFAGRLDP